MPGILNAKVFPLKRDISHIHKLVVLHIYLPVSAMPITSEPESKAGQVQDWIGVGSEKDLRTRFSEDGTDS